MPGISDILQNQGNNHKLTEFVNRYTHFQVILDMGEKNLQQITASGQRKWDTIATNERWQKSTPLLQTVSHRFLTPNRSKLLLEKPLR